MSKTEINQIAEFFSAINGWRAAYTHARLYFVGIRQDQEIILVSARIYLKGGNDRAGPPRFSAGNIEAGHWDVAENNISVESVVEKLLSDEGLHINEVGNLRLKGDSGRASTFATVNLFHPEGLSAGNRIGVLSMIGMQRSNLAVQPETDWQLKAGQIPFETLNELCVVYELGALSGDATRLEVVASTTVQVLTTSVVTAKQASIGLWMLQGLDRSKARIGYRVLDKGDVVMRGAVAGKDLIWQEDGYAIVGKTLLDIPSGALVQCIASYEGQAHHVAWRADPSFFQNPRVALMSIVDSGQKLIRSYLHPEQPYRPSAANDFEMAISWILWASGFSTASFGINPKTTDLFDIVAVSPLGDFIVVECTLGLLKGDSKLSKLVARAETLRQQLDASEMRFLRVLPVIITAMSLAQVNADVAQAESNGVLVLTRDNFDNALNEMLRFPDANRSYERAFELVGQKRLAQNK